MNFLSIHKVTSQGDALLLGLPGAGAVAVPSRGQGTPAILGVHGPEHLSIVGADAPDALHGTTPFSRGDAVALRIPKDACLLFDQNGQAMPPWAMLLKGWGLCLRPWARAPFCRQYG